MRDAWKQRESGHASVQPLNGMREKAFPPAPGQGLGSRGGNRWPLPASVWLLAVWNPLCLPQHLAAGMSLLSAAGTQATLLGIRWSIRPAYKMLMAFSKPGTGPAQERGNYMKSHAGRKAVPWLKPLIPEPLGCSSLSISFLCLFFSCFFFAVYMCACSCE